MTAASLAPLLTAEFFSNQGLPLVGGLLYTYSAGTSTPVATYTDYTGTTANPNPIVLNSRGETPSGIWLLPNVGYKFVLQDSSGNAIWTRDQVFNSSLVTYYGVDTGAANTYVVTAATPYTAYANGMIVYFVPGNTNTGASTINVNGLGPISIVNPNGTALGAGQITAGVMTGLIYYNGSFQLISLSSFTGVTVGTFGAEVPIASAATVDLGTAPAHVVLITGTTTITSLGSSANVSAPIYIVRFSSSLTLTYNATSMILPGATSIVTMAGDAAIFEYLGSGNWKCLIYQSVGGQQNAKIKPADTQRLSTTTPTADPDLYTGTLGVGRYSYELYLLFDSVAGGAGFQFTNGGTLVDSRGVVPGLATGYVNGASVGPLSSSFYSGSVSYATVSTGSNSNEVLYKGSILVSTPGTFGINWAQAVSTASNTTLRAGSYLITTLLNTGSSANLVQHVYTTSGTETVPSGYNTLTIEVWGASGGGGGGFGTIGINNSGGGGGASGGYARTTVSVTGLGGATIAFTCGAAGTTGTGPGGAGGTSSTGATTGGLTVATMTCTGGLGGSQAVNSPVGGAGGIAGTASGGTVVNTPGNAGSAGIGYPGGGIGGTGAFGVAGINGGGNKGGTGSPSSFPAGTTGGTGIVIFSYV